MCYNIMNFYIRRNVMSKEYGKYVRGGAPATEKFDMDKPPVKQRAFLHPFVIAYGYIRRALLRGKVHKTDMKGVKPPYILLCNHNAFYDFYIMSTAIAPYSGIFPAAVDDYIGREKGLRDLGTVPKRKYTADVSILRQCRKTLHDGGIFGIYAEARYSLCGVTEVIPEAVGQLLKHQKVPVVTLTCRGHHIYDPFWGNHRHRLIPVEADMRLAFTPEQLKEMTVPEISAKVNELLYNDDFRWQSENRVKVKYKKRAEGLHKVLYQCPHCGAEYKTDSKGDTVFCNACGKRWKLNYYGELEAQEGETEFKFPTDWYKWERENVKKEVQEGKYYFECEAHVNDLPNSKGFVRLGQAKFVHDMNGFSVKGVRDYDGEPFEMNIDAAGQYAIHVEYAYRFGNYEDCIDLNTLDDTWYVFPENCEFSITKISLATEEIYNEIWRQRKSRKNSEV